MSKNTLEGWFKGRVPEIPVPFLPLLLPDSAAIPASVEELADRGERALRKALDRPGRNRGAAFDLLAADAFLTYACEATTKGGEVGEGLTALLARLGERFR